MHPRSIHYWSAAAVGGASASRNTEEVSSSLLIAVWDQEAESDCLKMVVWHAGPGGQRSELNEACAACEEDMLKVQGRTFTTSGIARYRCSWLCSQARDWAVLSLCYLI